MGRSASAGGGLSRGRYSSSLSRLGPSQPIASGSWEGWGSLVLVAPVGGVRLLAERCAVGVRGITRVGALVVGIGPLGRVGLADRGIERVVGIAVFGHGFSLPGARAGKLVHARFTSVMGGYTNP